MSRSVKKNPIVKDSPKSSKENKQIANRIIRRKLKNSEFEIANGKAYKKLYNSWEIHDYVSRWSLEEALEAYRHSNEWSFLADTEFRRKYPTEEKFISYWKKMMLRK